MGTTTDAISKRMQCLWAIWWQEVDADLATFPPHLQTVIAELSDELPHVVNGQQKYLNLRRTDPPVVDGLPDAVLTLLGHLTMLDLPPGCRSTAVDQFLRAFST